MRVVAAVWLRDGRLFAAQRPLHKKQGGLWELPGGKVEPDEADAAAIVRELHEELGVTVRAVAPLATVVHPYEHGVIELVAWHVEGGGEPVAHEHAALRWVAAPDLDAVEWAPADRALLPRIRAAMAGG